jgi:transposase
MKQQQWGDVIQAVIERRMGVERAAHILNRSIRQVYRLVSKARKLGVSNIAHGNTGKTPSNKIGEEVWNKVLLLARTRYRNSNDYQLQRILKEEHNLTISRESLRKKLRASGISPKGKSSGQQH